MSKLPNLYKPHNMSKDLFLKHREQQDSVMTAPTPPRSMYTIRQDHMTVLALVEEAEGILTPELETALALTKEDFESKAVSYAYVVKGFENTQEVIDKEIKRLNELKKKAATREELFKSILSGAMQEFGIEKIETPTMKLSFRKSNPVELTEDFEDKVLKYVEVNITLSEDAIDDAPEEDRPVIKALTELIQCLDVKITASKKKIGDALKQGVVIPGAGAPEKKNLQIK